MKVTRFFVVCVRISVIFRCAAGTDAQHIRRPRQAVSLAEGPLLTLPLVSRVFSQVPSPTAVSESQCFALTGSAPPAGCAYIPDIVNPLTNQLLSCRLECSDQSVPLQPFRPILGSFPSIMPEYLITNTFQVADQTSMDLFTGDSYAVIYPATTTTTSTTTTTLKPVTTTTVAQPTKPTIPPTVGNIATCICSPDFGVPPSGCTWAGTGSGNPLTCAPFCPCFAGPCSSDKNNERCLLQKGPPTPGCSYTGLGSGDGNTLTCPEACVTQCP